MPGCISPGIKQTIVLMFLFFLLKRPKFINLRNFVSAFLRFLACFCSICYGLPRLGMLNKCAWMRRNFYEKHARRYGLGRERGHFRLKARASRNSSVRTLDPASGQEAPESELVLLSIHTFILKANNEVWKPLSAPYLVVFSAVLQRALLTCFPCSPVPLLY